MKRASFLLCLLLACGACRPQQMELSIVLPGDGGCMPVDLSCVNYLQFKVADVTDTKNPAFTTNCIKVTERLESLCDLRNVATGQELFKLPPDRQVIIEIKGMRVYPALSCDYDVSCPPRVAFRGSTGNQPVSVGAVAGGEVSLMVVMVAPCPAGKEVFYYPSLPDEPCSTVCIQGEVACDGISGGCLCFYPSATPDAGR